MRSISKVSPKFRTRRRKETHFCIFEGLGERLPFEMHAPHVPILILKNEFKQPRIRIEPIRPVLRVRSQADRSFIGFLFISIRKDGYEKENARTKGRASSQTNRSSRLLIAQIRSLYKSTKWNSVMQTEMGGSSPVVLPSELTGYWRRDGESIKSSEVGGRGSVP